MPSRLINNIHFNYELLGSRNDHPALVLVPGYACDINFWRSLAEKLAAERQVLIFDNQGIGKTIDNNAPLTLEIMTANIKKLIAALNLRQPILAGFAMGGIIAQKLAHNYPHDFSKLILLNSVMKFNDKAKEICEQLCVLREKNSLATYCDLIYDTAFGKEFKKNLSKENFCQDFMPLAATVQTATGQRRQVEVLKACDSTSWVKNIKIPTLVIASEEDQFGLPKEAKTLADAIATNGTKVDYVIVPHSGHSTLAEQPEKVLQIFQTFLKN